MEDEQITLLPDDKSAKKTRPKILKCKIHPWAHPEYDFVETTTDVVGDKIKKKCRYCLRNLMENKQIRQSFWQEEKEKITDRYVKTILRSGRNGIKGDVPQPVIEATRAVVQLKRKIKKMDEPLKECHIHGKLYKDGVVKRGKKNDEIIYRCKKCLEITHKKHYELHKAKIKIKHKQYRQENIKKVRAAKIKSKDKYLIERIVQSPVQTAHYLQRLKKLREGDSIKIRQINERRHIRLTTDGYIRRKIVQRSSLKAADIPDALIEAKRAVLLLKRSVKRKNEERIIKLIGEKLNVKEN